MSIMLYVQIMHMYNRILYRPLLFHQICVCNDQALTYMYICMYVRIETRHSIFRWIEFLIR